MTKIEDFPVIELTAADRNTLKAVAFTLQETLDDIEQIGVRYVKTSSGEREPMVYMGKEGQAAMDNIQNEIEMFKSRLSQIVSESIDTSDVAVTPV